MGARISYGPSLVPAARGIGCNDFTATGEFRLDTGGSDCRDTTDHSEPASTVVRQTRSAFRGSHGRLTGQNPAPRGTRLVSLLPRLQQTSKLLDRQICVANEATHG